MRATLMASIAMILIQCMAGAPAHAEVRYIPDAPGFIEITGADFDLYRAGNLKPRADLPNGACVPIAQGGCHCPNIKASGSVNADKRMVLAAQRVNRCPGIPGLASGNFDLTSIYKGTPYDAKVTLNVSGNAFSGSSIWQCCPKTRTDPLSSGVVSGTRIEFTRICTGQGYDKPCVQIYTGTLTGPNQAAGRWTMNGADAGTWSTK